MPIQMARNNGRRSNDHMLLSGLLGEVFGSKEDSPLGGHSYFGHSITGDGANDCIKIDHKVSELRHANCCLAPLRETIMLARLLNRGTETHEST